jgi:glycosyltransferase involved in cell wall biosynthesis
VLHKELSLENTGFHVLYCADTEPDRNWAFDPAKNEYPYTIMTGFHPVVKGFYPHFNPSVVKRLMELKPTRIIIAGSWNTPTMILAILYLQLRKTKTYFWSEGHADSMSFEKGIVPFIKKRILTLFDGFAVPNEKSLKFISEYIGLKDKKFVFLPNTVDDGFFTKAGGHGLNGALKEKYGITGKKIAIQVSQLEDRKGVVELVKGWMNLKPEIRKQWVLLLVGDGSKAGEINQMLEETNGREDIRLLGHVDVATIRDLLHVSQLFILATKKDPNPLSPIEAAFSALPILISVKAGNAADLVEESVNGHFIPEISPASINEILARTLQKTNVELESMGRKSQKVAFGKFGTKAVVRNLLTQIKS